MLVIKYIWKVNDRKYKQKQIANIKALRNTCCNSDLFHVSLDKAIKRQECRSKITSVAFKGIQAFEKKNTTITKLFGDIMLIFSSGIRRNQQGKNLTTPGWKLLITSWHNLH